jgi:hypothetical protein
MCDKRSLTAPAGRGSTLTCCGVDRLWNRDQRERSASGCHGALPVMRPDIGQTFRLEMFVREFAAGEITFSRINLAIQPPPPYPKKTALRIAKGSPGMRGTVIKRVRARFNNGARQHFDHHRCGAVRIARPHVGVMAAGRQVGDYGCRNSFVQQQIAAIPGVIVEAGNQVTRLERGASTACCAFKPNSTTFKNI